jgi:hypothetical protein
MGAPVHHPQILATNKNKMTKRVRSSQGRHNTSYYWRGFFSEGESASLSQDTSSHHDSYTSISSPINTWSHHRVHSPSKSWRHDLTSHHQDSSSYTSHYNKHGSPTSPLHKTWESISKASREWQKVTKYQVTVDTVTLVPKMIKTATLKRAVWNVLHSHKQTQHYIVHKTVRIPVIRYVHHEYQALVSDTLHYQAVTNVPVQVQTLTSRYATVGHLTHKYTTREYVRPAPYWARSLRSTKVTIQEVKKVRENVRQNIHYSIETIRRSNCSPTTFPSAKPSVTTTTAVPKIEPKAAAAPTPRDIQLQKSNVQMHPNVVDAVKPADMKIKVEAIKEKVEKLKEKVAEFPIKTQGAVKIAVEVPLQEVPQNVHPVAPQAQAQVAKSLPVVQPPIQVLNDVPIPKILQENSPVKNHPLAKDAQSNVVKAEAVLIKPQDIVALHIEPIVKKNKEAFKPHFADEQKKAVEKLQEKVAKFPIKTQGAVKIAAEVPLQQVPQNVHPVAPQAQAQVAKSLPVVQPPIQVLKEVPIPKVLQENAPVKNHPLAKDAVEVLKMEGQSNVVKAEAVLVKPQEIVALHIEPVVKKNEEVFKPQVADGQKKAFKPEAIVPLAENDNVLLVQEAHPVRQQKKRNLRKAKQ